MEVIDEEGKKYNTRDLELLSTVGKSSIVYKVDSDKVLKVTDDFTPIRERYLEIVDELRSEEYSCLIKILSLVKYNDNVCGTLSLRYKHDNNLLHLSIDELLSAIFKLEEDINRLSSKKIVFYDVFDSANCFVCNNQFVVIDCWDFFEKTHATIEEIKKYNQYYLKTLIVELLLEKTRLYELCDFLLTLGEEIDSDKTVVRQFEKHLRKINTSLYNHFYLDNN